MRGHLSSRVRAISSWTIAGTLTLVLSTTAVALMAHAPANRAPLSEPIAAHSSPTTVPSEAPVTSEAPTTAPPAPTTLAPVPTTVTYTYSYGGDDNSSGAYGDD